MAGAPPGRLDRPPDDSGPGWFIDQLADTLVQLHQLSARIMLATIVNLVLTGVGFYIGTVNRSTGDGWIGPDEAIRIWSVLIPEALALAGAMLLLARYDGYRRRGDAMFDELSDLLQRDLAANIESAAEEAWLMRSQLRDRVGLREYRSGRALPFTTGQSGTGIYAGVNLALVLLTIVGIFIP